jgi:fumarylacetoacetase
MPSWIDTANAADCDFPLQNLPFGVFSKDGEAPRCCTAIGDRVLDLAALEGAGLIRAGGIAPVFNKPELNAFMALGPAAWASVREQLNALLADGGNPELQDDFTL